LFFDLDYFDAFAPDLQPEMWKKNIAENESLIIVRNI